MQEPGVTERGRGREMGYGVHIHTLTLSEPGILVESFNLIRLSFLILKLGVRSWMAANP